jgi:HK97 family phage portal protein
MGFLEGFRFQGHGKDGWEGMSGRKSQFFTASSGGAPGQPYKDDWDVERAVSHGNDRVTWVYKSVYAISSNAARLRAYVADTDGAESGNHFLVPVLNRMANPYHDAYNFRFQLSSQILLSKRGAFIEVVRNRLDEITGLHLLPPQHTYPIPDAKTFVSGFKVEMPHPQKDRIIPAENVIWVRIPHPIDPYRGQSPLESCGLATEIDYYSRVFNRNFMINDGRPGGILMVKGEMDDDSADELRRRFLGTTGSALGGAGRLTIMEAEHAAYFDTSVTNRDSQYSEAKQLAKEEILMAFGVPESVVGNAKNSTFANADTELEVFWRETMLPHLMLIERALDRIDGSEDLTVKFDLSDVAILSRDERERASFHLSELTAGGITIDEYRALTGRERVGADHLFIQGNLMAVGQAPEDGKPEKVPIQVMPRGQAGPAVTPPTASSSRDAGSPTSPPSTTGNPAPVVPRKSEEVEEAKADDAVPLSETKWGFHFGTQWIDSKEADLARLRRDQQLARLEDSIAIQMTAFFQRQRRVVLEKWKSRKMREKINKGHSVSVGEIFDQIKWDKQLTDDARSFLAAALVDGGNDVALMVGKSFDVDDGLVAAAVIAGLERVKEINATTRRRLEKSIAKGLASGKSVDDIASDIEDVFGNATKSRARTIGRTEASFAVNEGQLIAASQSGLRYKIWLSSQDEKVRHTHTNTDGQARLLMDPFVVGGNLMMHPGAPTAPAEETVNCRCTMLFTDKAVTGALAEFDIDPVALRTARLGSQVGTIVAGAVALSVAATSGQETADD